MPTQNVRAFHDRRLRAPADQVWTWCAFTFLTNFTLSPLGSSSILYTLHFSRLTFHNLELQYLTCCDDLDSKITSAGAHHFLEAASPSIYQGKRLSLVP